MHSIIGAKAMHYAPCNCTSICTQYLVSHQKPPTIVCVVSHVIISLGVGLGGLLKSQGLNSVEFQLTVSNWPKLEAHHFELGPHRYYYNLGGISKPWHS